jgi:WXG100 family type VII secretion target
MSGYGITPEEMAKAATDVDNINEESRNLINSLRGNLDPLRDNWKGNASRAFATLMERYDADAAKLSEALAGIAEQLKSSGAAYVQQEEESSQSLSNISNVLGG